MYRSLTSSVKEDSKLIQPHIESLTTERTCCISVDRLSLAKDALPRFPANAFPVLNPVLRQAGKKKRACPQGWACRRRSNYLSFSHHLAALELSRTLRKELSNKCLAHVRHMNALPSSQSQASRAMSRVCEMSHHKI
jgi:hypothetical protein